MDLRVFVDVNRDFLRRVGKHRIPSLPAHQPCAAPYRTISQDHAVRDVPESDPPLAPFHGLKALPAETGKRRVSTQHSRHKKEAKAWVRLPSLGEPCHEK